MVFLFDKQQLSTNNRQQIFFSLFLHSLQYFYHYYRLFVLSSKVTHVIQAKHTNANRARCIGRERRALLQQRLEFYVAMKFIETINLSYERIKCARVLYTRLCARGLLTPHSLYAISSKSDDIFPFNLIASTVTAKKRHPTTDRMTLSAMKCMFFMGSFWRRWLVQFLKIVISFVSNCFK